jgi:hypothetical protein
MSNLIRQLALPSFLASQRTLAREFLSIFPADTYRIQVLKRREAGKARTRNFKAIDAAEFLRLVDSGTLARENASGACIFARPIRRDLVLVDDLPPNAIPTLRSIGLEPLAVIQSSPAKTNAILYFPGIEHDDAPLHSLVQRSVVEALVDLGLPADPAATRDQQAWRLPGYVNRKLKDDGTLKYQPIFAAKFLLQEPGVVPRRAAEFLARVREQIAGDEGPMTPTRERMAIAASLGETLNSRTIYAPDKYVAAILQRVVDAPKGERNWVLYHAGFTLFRLAYGCSDAPGYVERTGLSVDRIAAMLARAGAAAGLGEKEVAGTLKSASRAAAVHPVFPEVVGAV